MLQPLTEKASTIDKKSFNQALKKEKAGNVDRKRFNKDTVQRKKASTVDRKSFNGRCKIFNQDTAMQSYNHNQS